MGEQGVALENRIDCPFMRRNIINPHAVKKYVPLGRRLKTTDDTKRGCLAAPTGTQQREEFLIVDIKVDVVKDHVAVKGHGAV